MIPEQCGDLLSEIGRDIASITRPGRFAHQQKEGARLIQYYCICKHSGEVCIADLGGSVLYHCNLATHLTATRTKVNFTTAFQSNEAVLATLNLLYGGGVFFVRM